MTELVGKSGEPFPLYRITQDLVEGSANKLLDGMRAAGAPVEDIEELQRQLHGGECPWCHKPWKKKEVQGDVTKTERVWDKEKRAWVEETKVLPAFLGAFSYFIPSCYCYKKFSDNRNSETNKRAYIDERLEEAHIPKGEWASTFANWDYGVSEKITDSMKACNEWYRADYWKDGKGLILCGAVGTGKTRCAVMIAQEILEKEPERRLRFLPMADLITFIIRDQTEQGYIEALLGNEIIIVDDMDKVPVDKEWARNQIFSFFDACIREGVCLIGTTNLKGPDEMAEKFDYSIVSRIMGKCFFLPFDGTRDDDYRIIRRKYEK
jgi:DNA replication protein DnaC